MGKLKERPQFNMESWPCLTSLYHNVLMHKSMAYGQFTSGSREVPDLKSVLKIELIHHYGISPITLLNFLPSHS